MDDISLETLKEMQRDLLQKQCYLDIQKAFVNHFIKERSKNKKE